MWKKEEKEIKQYINTCITIRLYNTKGILNIPKTFCLFLGCFLDIFRMFFVCLEHPVTSKIQIYMGYVFEKKEATFCISSNRKK